jgi:hypothetical protein
MKEVDIDYWMKGVRFGQYRGRIIREFLDLMDASYQEREWVEQQSNTSFVANIEFPFDMFFNELDLQEYFDKKAVLYNWIGEIFKDEREVDALHSVSKILYKLCKSCYYDEDFFASPYLESMRQASAEAFRVFMENEKDNKEFCEFIAELQERRKRESLADKREM